MISMRRRLPRALIALIVLVAGSPAHAHKGATEGPVDAATWVRQALAFLELKPPNLGEAAERIDGALKAKDAQGVDLTLLGKAMEALKARNAEAAIAALTAALEPPSPRTPEVSGETPRALSSPHHDDDDAAAHHFPGASLKAIEPRFGGSAGEYVLLGFGGVLMATGLFALRRTARHGREGLR